VATVTVHQAKTTLSKLIERASAGEEIVIAKGKVPVALLLPIAAQGGRKFGAMRGKARVDEKFFEPLPEEELDAWER
jgi:prevent-host-death family protein